MHFNVESPMGSGVVNLHKIKSPTSSEFEYKLFALDVKGTGPDDSLRSSAIIDEDLLGRKRLYLESTGPAPTPEKTPPLKMFGVQWR